MKRFGFRKWERLHSPSEFREVYSKGKFFKGKFLILYLLYNRNKTPLKRLGISVDKNVKGAVERNKLKRYVREIFRLNKNRLIEGIDLVVVIKPESIGLNFHKMERELLQLFNEAHLLGKIPNGTKDTFKTDKDISKPHISFFPSNM
ncbi:MAG: ribonuclease P protein component [bacterium]|nr:ribonuclease P protein component [bacterium]